MPDLEADLFNLAMSEQAQPLMDAVKKHISDNVEPITEEFFALDKDKSCLGKQAMDRPITWLLMTATSITPDGRADTT